MISNRKPTSGDPCPDCGGKLQVVDTHVQGDSRVRYLGCRACGYRPDQNKQIVPIEYAPRRTISIRRLRIRGTEDDAA